MDIAKILVELRAEQKWIDQVISALVRLPGRGRGRPPKWLVEAQKRKTPRRKPDKG